ncbi:histidinol-phosphate aminotransferase [Parasphingorhabdus marina DSM 22363]|uniref:Histidinol-phosphate aminotransferase n=1 Tax=Parasphingorhabdus marina DSM 22363 TaxID=1123272 RepID=A0A1N6CPW5_9SPHN|nr:histidinol-phosphate transaminase [Parasphingorhabdus marina]SIN60552.1 histidinol-phosphate aminotransferase [Parasphingorhabdus marina DSM 22363]
MSKPQPKDWIMGIAPYVPGKSSSDSGQKLVKLSANENPLGCSPAAKQALSDASGEVPRYPDPGSTKLREAIAAKHDLDPARIICGTGSDDILHLAANAFSGPGDEIIYVRYGFAVYDIAARRYGGTPVIADDVNYGTDVDAILAKVTDRTRVVFIANPNNPTGTLSSAEEIRRLQAALPAHVLLVLDGAYAEYLEADEDDQALEMAATLPNVLVTRTFSKIHGLAAERIGWGYGPEEIIGAMNRIRLPFNVTTAGQEAALAALASEDFVASSREHNRRWRQWLSDELTGMGNHGLRVIPSHTNFLLVLLEGKVTAEQANNALMEKGYAVRWLPGQGLVNGLRITIGTEEETRGVAAALRAILEAA